MLRGTAGVRSLPTYDVFLSFPEWPQRRQSANSAADCQSALDWDPRSASKGDPFDRRVLMVALAASELVGVAETARARVVGRSSARLLNRQLSLPVSIMSQ